MNGLPKNYTIALQAAIDASFVVMQFYNTSFTSENKSDGSPVTEADKSSSDLINSRLKETNIPIIGEEILNTDFSIRKNWTENWCVDPLDGTKEFIKKNGEFVINIAHIVHGNPVFGIIVSPVERKILVGGIATGVFIGKFDTSGQTSNWEEQHANSAINIPMVLISSRSFHSTKTAEFVEKLRQKYGSLTYLEKGSALKFFDLATGKADIYPRFAPTMEWDIAAGQAILEALGGTIVNVQSGQPLIYNKEELYNPFFIAQTKASIQYKLNPIV
jgi:3'(2'), 5'-bisphosphate nucleotidase